ncbi:replication initiator [Micromonospora sp. RL09-050-HVF-A]|uniref:replication initiator n=1 Tax=Micromonospora sp. RL09-050-HVF-A TaxID=1703433 RepID=UPI001C5F7D7A|nr:replication initiator [Micromonospora sp. RL09-050-HVF-A]MBW4704036.1 replication initiation protein [Micromonospora sp. RL09-050-HVF-A]
MTAPTLPGLEPATPTPVAVPRPGSRAARMALPRSVDVLKEIAAEYGVCVRPLAMRRTDLDTGLTEVIDLPCGATREDKCAPCAKKNRRLRQAQIREGWHRDDEPLPPPEPATEEQKALILFRAHLEFSRDEAIRAAEWGQVEELDEGVREVEEAITAEGLRGRVGPPHAGVDEDADDDTGRRRKRSTKRRQDAPELPRRKVERRTVGRTYTAADGSTYRPSMWLTLTLDSYGPVRPDGTPVNPDRYDYRRAAWDAVHFPRLLDRFWQNLRRCEGWNVQYAGCVEPQRRLAPHAHFAIRGTIPRDTLRTVAAATYHQVWWPTVDVQQYTADRPPVWDEDAAAWVDPDTRCPLTTWTEALDAIDNDPDAEPVHVVRFGTQVDARGVMPGTTDAERTIRYVTKYITKHTGDVHKATTDRHRKHLDRLWRELRVTPCTDRCANWLLYGVQPKKANPKLKPGRCKGKVHQRDTLGIGGRRILISRDWSGKTLSDHKHDVRAWVRALLGTTTDSGAADNTRQLVDDQGDNVERVRHAWELARPDDPDVGPLSHRLMRSISERARWRSELLAAKDRAAQGSADPSATQHNARHDGEEGDSGRGFDHRAGRGPDQHE